MIHELPPSVSSCSIPPLSPPSTHRHSQPARSVIKVDQDLFGLDNLIRLPNMVDPGGLPQSWIFMRGSLEVGEIFSFSSLVREQRKCRSWRVQVFWEDLSPLMEDLRPRRQIKSCLCHVGTDCTTLWTEWYKVATSTKGFGVMAHVYEAPLVTFQKKYFRKK